VDGVSQTKGPQTLAIWQETRVRQHIGTLKHRLLIQLVEHVVDLAPEHTKESALRTVTNDHNDITSLMSANINIYLQHSHGKNGAYFSVRKKKR
jgi:hypothetical protein